MYAIANAAGVKRLTISVAAPNGNCASMEFRAESTNAPLVAQDPGIPTEKEINELYLRVSGWDQGYIDGMGELWEAPLSGGAFAFEDAIARQDAREEMEARADGHERITWNECEKRGMTILDALEQNIEVEL